MISTTRARWAGGVLAAMAGCADPAAPADGAGTTDASSAGETGAAQTDTGGSPATAMLDSSGEGTTASVDDTGQSTGDVVCALSDLGAVVAVGQDCCGCLCGATGWSCSHDTCLDPDGTAPGLAPEAGFLEIASFVSSYDGLPHESPRSRVWYSFWPADDDPENRPLMLLFNGGPGAATGLLFGANTAPFSLDPQLSDSVMPTARPWTEVANLLYVDAPSTGFSYSLPLQNGTQPPVGIDADQDASVFIAVLLRFLARHPALADNPVVLVGESYGGTRSTLMLEQLLDYETLADGRSPYQNEALHAEVTRHWAGVYPGTCGEGITRDQVAAQFGHFVSIQGLVAGIAQVLEPGVTSPSCIADGDLYHCDRPAEWLDDVIAEVGVRLRQPDLLDTVLGVDPTTIAWMHAEARVGAYARDVVQDEGAMVSAFGALEAGDAYYVGYNEAVGTQQTSAHDFFDEAVADSFLRAASATAVFMTDGRLDNAVKTYTLPPVLAARPALSAATYDPAPRPGVDRPGWFALTYAAGASPDGATTREIRVPRYDQAGHTVTLDTPELLLDDVTAWLAE